MTAPMLAQLLNRSSMPRLIAPAPSDAELEQALQAGLRAPDHAYLRPTRLHVVSGDGLRRLGDLFVAAALDDDPDAPDAVLVKHRKQPLRAPMIIVACCHPLAHDKVPEVEQVASTAACVSLLQTAFDSLGYASMWRTGAMAYHPRVRAAFDLDTADRLLAFLYVGTAAVEAKVRPALSTDDFVRRF